MVNMFIGATRTILSEYFSIAVDSVGTPGLLEGGDQMEQVTVLVSMIGDVEGQFLLGCTPATALAIARSMLVRQEYPEFDDLCRSALCELANIVGGNAATGLAEMGLSCELAPPSVITGEHLSIQSSATQMLYVPIRSSCGELKLFLALRNGSA
jgi:chemotaxis protein CheX